MQKNAIATAIIAVIAAGAGQALGKTKFTDICPDAGRRKKSITIMVEKNFPEAAGDQPLRAAVTKTVGENLAAMCGARGKRAYNKKGYPVAFDMGRITGVAFFAAGQGMGYRGRVAPYPDFYYIIDGGGAAFVSVWSQVEPR